VIAKNSSTAHFHPGTHLFGLHFSRPVVVDGDVRARFSEREGNSSADAAATAADKPDFA